MKIAFLLLASLTLIPNTAKADPLIMPLTPQIITCEKSGKHIAGANSDLFTARECGGSLPTAGYVGVPSILQVNGGVAGYRVDPPNNVKAPIWFFAYKEGNYAISVVYFRQPIIQ